MYILQGSIMTRSVSTISQVGSHASNDSSNDNSLWHLGLSHMSGKRFDILSK